MEQVIQNCRSIARLTIDLFLEKAKRGELERLKTKNLKEKRVVEEKGDGE